MSSGASGQHPRTLVIVPALNEEASLPGVLRSLLAVVPAGDILVVDDGSRDRTAAVASEHGVPVARLPFNLGVGGALQTGFRYAIRNGFHRAVQVDADGQHDPSQVDDLVAALEGGADMAIGSRFGGPDSSYRVGRIRGGAMRTLCQAVRILSGQRFSDTTSGFRAFSAPLIEYFAETYPCDYLGDTSEALLLACHNGFRIVEVPVQVRERAGGTPSNRNIRLVYHYVRALVSMLGATPIRRRQPWRATP